MKMSNFTMFKTRKNFEKMDKINVQKSICRITFVQKRAALGNLRNFFGGIFVRAYMVRRNGTTLNPIYEGQCQKGAKRRKTAHACPFFGHTCFQKKAFRVFGTVFGGFAADACPLFGHSFFQKKAFRFLGTVFGANWAHGMSLFWAFFFSDKMDRRFSGVPMRCDNACPFIHCPNQTLTRHRCSHRGHQNFPMMHDTCPLQDLCHSFSAIGRCCAPH
jgi:hypothetical protein